MAIDPFPANEQRFLHAFLEWEGLQFPRRVTMLKGAGNILHGSRSAIVSRDDSYRLVCELAGLSEDPFKQEMKFQKNRAKRFNF